MILHVRPQFPKKIGPVVDSGRIAAAKAEVIRLIEMNKQNEIAAVNEPEAAVIEQQAVIIEPEAAINEPDAPAVPKAPPAEFSPRD